MGKHGPRQRRNLGPRPLVDRLEQVDELGHDQRNKLEVRRVTKERGGPGGLLRLLTREVVDQDVGVQQHSSAPGSLRVMRTIADLLP